MKRSTGIDSIEGGDLATRIPSPIPLDVQLMLVVFDGASSSSTPVPNRGEIVVGRGTDAGLHLEDATVSRRHALVRGGAPPSVEDLGSINGTCVNGVPLPPGERRPILRGTTITFGRVIVAVEALAAVPSVQADHAWTAVDPATVAVFELAATGAPTMLTVLILGETGVGKELVAEHIHATSERSKGPFLRLNCAALAETLLEGELFGSERGAFTGASQTRVGLLESSDKGTIFLDEVGELSLSTQAKMLRFLESGEILRLGSTRPRVVDVRVISATNREPASGTTRSDFFFRLNGVTIHVPPLRARPADLLPLARQFARRAGALLGRPPPMLSEATERVLIAHSWPGNIRELRKVMERAVVLSRGGLIEPQHLMLSSALEPNAILAPVRSAIHAQDLERSALERETPRSQPVVSANHVGDAPAPASSGEPVNCMPSSSLRTELESLERGRILECLQQCGGNQSRAAKMLGITRRVLLSRLDAYGIIRPRKRPSSS